MGHYGVVRHYQPLNKEVALLQLPTSEISLARRTSGSRTNSQSSTISCRLAFADRGSAVPFTLSKATVSSPLGRFFALTQELRVPRGEFRFCFT